MALFHSQTRRHMIKRSKTSVGAHKGRCANAVVIPFARKCHCRDFPMPIRGQISAPFQLKIEQKLPKMMNYISNLQFGENSLKIRPKIGMLQMFKFTSW